MTRENRNYFSLHCIHLETQLVYANMQILSEVVATLVATQIKGHSEVCSEYMCVMCVCVCVTTVCPNCHRAIRLNRLRGCVLAKIS